MTGPTQPLTLGQIDASAEHYGVKIAALGEDGDMGIMVFTHDVRRALAAINRYARDLSGPVRHIALTPGPGWWTVVDNCGHGDACPHEPEEDGHRWHEDCEHYGLPPCKDVFGWLCVHSTAAAPGAVPAIEFEVDY